jgi:Fe-S-cluster containining protein
MSNLSTEVDNLKSKYRKIFLKTSEEIELRLEKIPAETQKEFLDEILLKEVFEKWLKIISHKTNFSCAGCAACCKLACSEFSPDELKQKAQNNDNFAQQFLSVFIPYETEEEAQKIYPEYFELLKIKAPNEKIYFYHCPKVTKENRCPDYENRPQICKDFPDNPIGFLPKTCGFNNWKQDIENSALKLRAAFEIIDFYKEKLNS